MEVQFAFPLQRKTKYENTIWVSFSYAIENRLALRYTDYCSIIVLVFGSSSMYSPGHTSILAAKIVSLTFLSELRTKTAIPIRSVQSVDCIPGKKCRLVTKCRLQIADRVQMQTDNLYCFSSDIWSHVLLQLTERHASAFPRSSFTIICTTVEYSLPVSWSQSFLI